MNVWWMDDRVGKDQEEDHEDKAAPPSNRILMPGVSGCIQLDKPAPMTLKNAISAATAGFRLEHVTRIETAIKLLRNQFHLPGCRKCIKESVTRCISEKRPPKLSLSLWPRWATYRRLLRARRSFD